ncbi:hypothetical protein N7539_008559 [Penicillium diatomitis]|uniref:JmjC domain-containing protein n=1 Tax=Penicillium diatomitis TaxID=2819901 RepID=A0A9W9WQU0_9EURO|nr:uncharacterized protein N7539_008559 [Penicillium diatomitis]KAJ5471990.1 hypothetical protein N7539_008559 [Penicillium diatomitis]
MEAPESAQRKKPRYNNEQGRSQERRKRKRGVEDPPKYPHWGEVGLRPFLGVREGQTDELGASEMYRFVCRLDGAARWAMTFEQMKADLIRDLTEAPKFGRLIAQSKIPRLLPLRQPDVILVDDETLEGWLRKKFPMPLLYRAEIGGKSPALKGMTWERFWKAQLDEVPDATVGVYDYSHPDPQDRITDWSVRQIHEYWKRPAGERGAINVLDLENADGDFCPIAIVSQDVAQKALRRKLRTAGRSDSRWESHRKEFFLLSAANAVSAIHVDNGGLLTWAFAEAGAQYVEACKDDGWVKVELKMGDILIMPPSWPHAVFTPEDCLAVGGHFYTVSHLGSTLAGLSRQERYPEMCNESLEPATYETLAVIFDCGLYDANDHVGILSTAGSFVHNWDLMSQARAIEAAGIDSPKDDPREHILAHRDHLVKPYSADVLEKPIDARGRLANALARVRERMRQAIDALP